MQSGDYVCPAGGIYRRDAVLGRWMPVPEEWALGELLFSGGKGLSAQCEFCFSQRPPTIPLGPTASLSAIGPLDKDASVYIMDTLARNNAYIPNHRLLGLISDEAILGAKDALPPCIFSEEGKTKEHQRATLERILQIQRRLARLGDHSYAHEEIARLKLARHLEEAGYTMHGKHVVKKKTYISFLQYVENHTRAAYCAIDAETHGPIDMARLRPVKGRKGAGPMKSDRQQRDLCSEGFCSVRAGWGAPLPNLRIDLPIAVVKSVLCKKRAERRKHVAAAIHEHARDVGSLGSMSSFYAGLFARHPEMQAELEYLEVDLRAEYARVQAEAALLSETEEGEIK
ncbi:uncharacterized protein NEMAJ01_0333 [Nematocida major]|uniref:uncharacterized protein n=1 Tax=Nematocida major TaxID=1912982 RepID=UPI0020089319|nr:uncharacterized protein NEMAJ01_0333 [Nematocida major]KAH9385437.1 hypothetical protein NEMAJ01_0333 [Nematocida major]